jgi:hypothetical protein
VTVEQKQRVVADRLEVPVVGAALLLTMDSSESPVHVEHDALGAVERLGLPQCLPVQRHQPDQILFPGQQLGLELVQRRGQRRAPAPDPLRTNQSERRGSCESLGVVEVLVARQAAVVQALSQVAHPTREPESGTVRSDARPLEIDLQGSIERELKWLIFVSRVPPRHPHHIETRINTDNDRHLKVRLVEFKLEIRVK